jgi:hypothetical protein
MASDGVNKNQLYRSTTRDTSCDILLSTQPRLQLFWSEGLCWYCLAVIDILRWTSRKEMMDSGLFLWFPCQMLICWRMVYLSFCVFACIRSCSCGYIGLRIIDVGLLYLCLKNDVIRTCRTRWLLISSACARQTPPTIFGGAVIRRKLCMYNPSA